MGNVFYCAPTSNDEGPKEEQVNLQANKVMEVPSNIEPTEWNNIRSCQYFQFMGLRSRQEKYYGAAVTDDRFQFKFLHDFEVLMQQQTDHIRKLKTAQLQRDTHVGSSQVKFVPTLKKALLGEISNAMEELYSRFGLDMENPIRKRDLSYIQYRFKQFMIPTPPAFRYLDIVVQHKTYVHYRQHVPIKYLFDSELYFDDIVHGSFSDPQQLLFTVEIIIVLIICIHYLMF
jgi:hypothetical protein